MKNSSDTKENQKGKAPNTKPPEDSLNLKQGRSRNSQRWWHPKLTPRKRISEAFSDFAETVVQGERQGAKADMRREEGRFSSLGCEGIEGAANFPFATWNPSQSVKLAAQATALKASGVMINRLTYDAEAKPCFEVSEDSLFEGFNLCAFNGPGWARRFREVLKKVDEDRRQQMYLAQARVVHAGEVAGGLVRKLNLVHALFWQPSSIYNFWGDLLLECFLTTSDTWCAPITTPADVAEVWAADLIRLNFVSFLEHERCLRIDGHLDKLDPILSQPVSFSKVTSELAEQFFDDVGEHN
jgi:hypothetical protein